MKNDGNSIKLSFTQNLIAVNVGIFAVMFMASRIIGNPKFPDNQQHIFGVAGLIGLFIFAVEVSVWITWRGVRMLGDRKYILSIPVMLLGVFALVCTFYYIGPFVLKVIGL